MYSNENNFEKEAYENNGKFNIYSLSAEGYENYLSKDSHNYHYLKNKYDPQLLKEVEAEMKEKRLQKEKEKNKQIEKKEVQSEPIKEEPKVQPTIKPEEKIEMKNTNPKVNPKTNTQKKETINKNNKKPQQQKIANNPRMPKISNIKDNRGKK